MNNLALCPLQSGYVPTIANSVLEQALVGGFARQRVQFVNNTHTVNVSVMLANEAQQQYFWAFWRIHTLNPQNFKWALICDDFELKTYECQFIPSSLQVGEPTANIVKVSFSVRCKAQNNTELAFDQGIIDAWETGNGLDFTDELEKLVNVKLPDALENLNA